MHYFTVWMMSQFNQRQFQYFYQILSWIWNNIGVKIYTSRVFEHRIDFLLLKIRSIFSAVLRYWKYSIENFLISKQYIWHEYGTEAVSFNSRCLGPLSYWVLIFTDTWIIHDLILPCCNWEFLHRSEKLCFLLRLCSW